MTEFLLVLGAFLIVAIAGGIIGYMIGYNKGRRHRWGR